MEKFKLVTDTSADLKAEYLEEHGVGLMHLSCLMDGETYGRDKAIDINTFYEKIRNGSMPTTSQVNPDEAKEEFLKYIDEYKNILCLSFTSGLSGTYQSAKIAAEEIMESNPDVNIVVIDTLCASIGQGYIVDKAVEMKENGATMQEIVDFVEENKLRVGHVVTVDDLYHLQRGGRVSKTSAVIGTMIGIKPMINVNNEGKLEVVSKARGRKKSLLTLVDMMEEKMGKNCDPKEKVFINHGDCLEDAQFVADEIKRRFGHENFVINHLGPVIGSHTGAGAIALGFWGEKRQ